MISVTAINQLLEREIDECLLDWSTFLVACSHSKDCVCVCVCSMCSRAPVWASLHRFVDCIPALPDTRLRYRL